MNGELNFSASTEGLDEKGRIIVNQTDKMDEALSRLMDAKQRLDSWKSSNKDLYDVKLNKAIDVMNDMIKTLRMYGEVLSDTSNRLRAVEERIRNMINA